MSIIELFVLCKGGNFNIHIWAWFYLKFGEDLISCLGREDVHAFHESPNRIHTERVLNSHLLTLKAHNHKMNVLSSNEILKPHR